MNYTVLQNVFSPIKIFFGEMITGVLAFHLKNFRMHDRMMENKHAFY